MKIIIIDGYNVIHHSPFLKTLLSRNVYRAQIELIKMACDYCSVEGIKGYVVFDAYRHSGDEVEKAVSPLVKVIYTGEGETADSYIERFIIQNKSKYSYIYVITSDYLEGETVLDKNILPVSPKSFLQETHSSHKFIKEKYSSNVPFMDYFLPTELFRKIRNKLKKP
ncbi:hypothetical protein DRI96_03270 [Candidatus Aerophobetes bacterium]|uniref:NYN domain-containing protein n=1 Tax=Aerophobetes bacterium TaxID=2030807 RepID=A0A662DGG1_UNCAE|nr:MAG: hypothetical protein DRI96_03270 [Candidatus Aerophobetes bacterium]